VGSVLSETTPAALPQFLRFLSSLPAPDAVARAMHLGPLAPLDFGAVSITRLADETLLLNGTHGYTSEEVDRYFQVPLSLVTPFTRCILQSEVLVDEIEDVLESFVALQMDAELWQGFMTRIGIGQVVSAPIVFQGTVIGAFGGITRSKRSWTSLDFALLDGLSSVLGLWMTHPDAPVPAPDRLRSNHQGTIHLTDRQLQILQLVEAGRSNTAIGQTLGYSVSTIKQELQKAMRSMRVSDRLDAAKRARELNLFPERVG
jgi:DNA-binding CsgD family transcriptional regulator